MATPPTLFPVPLMLKEPGDPSLPPPPPSLPGPRPTLSSPARPLPPLPPPPATPPGRPPGEPASPEPGAIEKSPQRFPGGNAKREFAPDGSIPRAKTALPSPAAPTSGTSGLVDPVDPSVPESRRTGLEIPPVGIGNFG